MRELDEKSVQSLKIDVDLSGDEEEERCVVS